MDTNIEQNPNPVNQIPMQNQTVSNTTSNSSILTPKPKSNKFGWTMVGVLAFLWVLMILVYIFIPGKETNVEKLTNPLKQEVAPGGVLTAEPTLSSSDEPQSLVSDIDNTSVDNLDAELSDIDKELATP